MSMHELNPIPIAADTRLARIQRILEMRDEIIPFLDPADGISPEQVTTFLSFEAQAAIDTRLNLIKMLEPYVQTVHSTLNDKLDHPEELLLKRGNKIQFLMKSSLPEHATLVYMRWKEYKVRDKREPTCEEAVFCEIPTSSLQEFTHQFIRTGDDVELPNFYNYFVGFLFEYGSLSAIVRDDETTKHPTHYLLNKFWLNKNEQFRVGGCTFFGFFYVKSFTNHYIYRYCQDGMFRREPVKTETPTIEEEVAATLSHLPFRDINTSQPLEVTI